MMLPLPQLMSCTGLQAHFPGGKPHPSSGSTVGKASEIWRVLMVGIPPEKWVGGHGSVT